MKSEHRHELKTNELAEWLSNLPQWARQNLRMIIYVSVVAVLLIVSVVFRWYRKNVESVNAQIELTGFITQLARDKIQILQNQARGFDSSYSLINLAESLQGFAQKARDDGMAALALIKRAEALRTELHYRMGTVSKEQLTNQISTAKTAYLEAIERLRAQGNEQLSRLYPSLMAEAQLGLGLCEEELGSFDKAEQIYSDIAANPDFEGTVAIAKAKLRLDTMADYQQKVVFKAPPKPAPTELVPPQMELRVPQSNLPRIEPGAADSNLQPQTPNNVPGNPLPTQ